MNSGLLIQGFTMGITVWLVVYGVNQAWLRFKGFLW